MGGIRGVTTCLVLPQLKATDADEGEFGRVWYRILHGEWAALGWQGEVVPTPGQQSFSSFSDPSLGDGSEGRTRDVLKSFAPSWSCFQ